MTPSNKAQIDRIKRELTSIAEEMEALHVHGLLPDNVDPTSEELKAQSDEIDCINRAIAELNDIE